MYIFEKQLFYNIIFEFNGMFYRVIMLSLAISKRKKVSMLKLEIKNQLPRKIFSSLDTLSN